MEKEKEAIFQTFSERDTRSMRRSLLVDSQRRTRPRNGKISRVGDRSVSQVPTSVISELRFDFSRGAAASWPPESGRLEVEK